MIPIAKPLLREEDAEAAMSAVANGDLTTGRHVDGFASELAEKLNLPAVVLTSSGTTALLMAIAWGCVSPKKVAVPAYGFIGTANAVRWMVGTNDRLLPIDVDPQTGCMSLSALEVHLKTGRVGAFIWVDFNGGVDSDTYSARRLAERYRVGMVEDSACGVGHRHYSRHAGLFGHIGVLSFSTPKIVTCGQGGAIVMHDSLHANIMGSLIHQGRVGNSPLIPMPGTNYRMADVPSAIGRSQLANIDVALKCKKRLHEAVKAAWPETITTDSGVPQYNIVRARDAAHRDKMLAHFKRANIDARKWHAPIWMHPAYSEFGDDYPGAQRLYDTAVYLPSGAGYTSHEIKQVAGALEIFRAKA